MSATTAIIGAAIFDGERRQNNSALLFANGRIVDIVDEADLPQGCEITELQGGLVVPGFIDLQVNGGGGIMFNQQSNLDGIRTICSAHRQFGTTGLLVTLITDSPQKTTQAIQASIDATAAGVPGFLGLHLEGPHLSRSKNGAHDADLIRKMTDDDLEELLQAAQSLLTLMITVAPESVTDEQIAQLSSAGIIVSLGHTNATYAQASRSAKAGARSITHLYNAMSPLAHREPGLVGAALEIDTIFAGLIADGIHVHPAAISIAVNAKKQGPGRLFLVTDAMATIGTDLKSFTLNGRAITRQDGRLTLENGTLAGADLNMISAVNFMVEQVGVTVEESLRMASLNPANCIEKSDWIGNFAPGTLANFIHLESGGGNHRQKINKIWIQGVPSFANAD